MVFFVSLLQGTTATDIERWIGQRKRRRHSRWRQVADGSISSGEICSRRRNCHHHQITARSRRNTIFLRRFQSDCRHWRRLRTRRTAVHRALRAMVYHHTKYTSTTSTTWSTSWTRHHLSFSKVSLRPQTTDTQPVQVEASSVIRISVRRYFLGPSPIQFFPTAMLWCLRVPWKTLVEGAKRIALQY